MPARKVPLEIRFWQKVDKTSTCWLWTGAINGHGYGHIKIEGRMQYAHRVAYELETGAIPDGLDVDHLCRVRHCVNPAHLEPVTRKANVLRGQGIAATNAARTHCSQGHKFSPENTYMHGGNRHCRACNRESAKKSKQRRTDTVARGHDLINDPKRMARIRDALVTGSED